MQANEEQGDSGRVSRRGLLAGAAAGAIGAGVAAGWGAVPAGAAPGGSAPAAFGPVRVGPGDRRYDGLVRGNNFRFVGTPDEVRVVGSADQVVAAVSDAVRSGRRIAARSGGHCFENFTAGPDVRMLLDLSPMDAVGYDPAHRAFSVQPGATLGHVYRTLGTGWGVTVPAGGCPEVGAGGHFAGGGYGPLSRRYGSVVDHLYGVEVVVVDKGGKARLVTATRERNDPNRDLWWAHTGGGGGNFGVVTRYLMRSPDATGSDPSTLLPPVPARMLERLVIWSWDTMTEQALTTILRNFGTWHERNSAPGSPNAGLYGVLMPGHRASGSFMLVVQADADLPNIDAKVLDFVTAVNAGTGVTPVLNRPMTFPWKHATTWPGTGEPGDLVSRRYKLKASYLRKSFTDGQLAAIWRNLTNGTGGRNAGMLMIGYGGQVGAVKPGDTATAQRGAVMKAVFQSIWTEEGEDAANLTWVRGFYRDVYSATGGAPVPDDVNDGCYINYPDNDMADPAWNGSGVPWSTLYYRDNYPRLQRVKARWDPRGVFRHPLSIEPPR